jgi:porphobilinogen synthase
MFYRGRRLRSTPVLREMVRETSLSAAGMVMLYFVEETDDKNYRRPVAAMPGQFRYSLDELEKAVAKDVDKGLRSCMLFGIPAYKDAVGSGAYAENGIVQEALQRLRARFPSLYLISDVCLCEYTEHGHCGLITPKGEVRNDATLELLARAAVSHVRAGADMVAPSDMMDGRVLAIREALDHNGFTNTPIMSYAVKYASAFYGPFREAAGSAPSFGDRKSYQMDPANRREALREAAADAEEGADILMVKPAGCYLDIIRDVRETFDLPVAAYQVSGEYAMIKAAGQMGWIDETAVLLESLIGIKRAGADLILSYFTSELLQQGIVE